MRGAPVKKLRYAFVALVVLSLAVGAVAILFSVSYYHREQDAQRHQGQLLEQRLCTTLDRLAALKPPPGDPGSNPARGFDQQQHAVLAELGPDVGCPVKP
jgi:hypothetical protein